MAQQRFLSVDFLRGATVAFMIVANNPGDAAFVYSALVHARWHGWTAVDCIFPMFLFLVGVSVALASGGASANRPGLWEKAWKRAAILFGLGLFVNGFPYFHLETLRIPGVLQRIAVVYLAVLWLYRRLDWRVVAALIIAILVGYWLLWACVPVPGLGFPTLDYEYNLESWLDQMFMRGHLWEYDTSWDPEGILSTFPCIALGLLGALAGRRLKQEPQGQQGRLAAVLAAWGAALVLAGLAWDRWFPINKSITTSSFVLFTGGIGVLLLAALHRIMDRDRAASWMQPFLALGKNALFLYVVSELLTKALYIARPSFLTGGRSLHFWLFDALFGGVANRYVASFAWSVSLTAVLTVVAMLMDRRGISVRL